MRQNPAARYLGLRLMHGERDRRAAVRVQHRADEGRVARGARRLVQRSRIRRVHASSTTAATSHLDPLSAAPGRNHFLKTVVPFLDSAR